MSGMVLVLCEIKLLNFIYTDIEAKDGICLEYQFAFFCYLIAIFSIHAYITENVFRMCSEFV